MHFYRIMFPKTTLAMNVLAGSHIETVIETVADFISQWGV